MLCPRDGTALISPEDIDKSVFSRNGIFHCPTCSGLALNSGAASSEICSEKLKSIVTNDIRKIANVQSTLTMLVIEQQEKS